MSELIQGLLAYSSWEKFANLHGLLATFSLVLFGAALALTPIFNKTKKYLQWFKVVVTLLFVDLFLATINGLYIYQSYRAPIPTSPRSLIIASNKPWLHKIVFEHKEFLAFLPWLLVFAVVFIVWHLGRDLKKPHYNGLNRVIFLSLLLALIFTLIIAGEAVLVTKFAPLS